MRPLALFVPLVAGLASAACQTVKVTDGSSLRDDAAGLCLPSETYSPFSLQPITPAPDLAALGVKGATAAIGPTELHHLRLDVCVAADDTPRVRQIAIARRLTADQPFNVQTVNVIPGTTTLGLGPALFEERWDEVLIDVLAAGILPYFQIKGWKQGGRTFVAAAFVTKSNGHIVSKDGGWLVGTLAYGHSFTTPVDPCGGNGAPFKTSYAVGSAKIVVVGCVVSQVGEGTTHERALTIEITDMSELLPAAARGTRKLTGQAAAEAFRGGAGHHGCHYSMTLKLPEAKYHQGQRGWAGKIVDLVRYGDGTPQRSEKANPNGPLHAGAACDPDPEDPPGF